MLKLTKNSIFCLRVVFLKERSFPEKKASKEYYYHAKGCVQHLLKFLTFFQVTENWINYSDSFFPAEYDYRRNFFLSRPAFLKLYVKNLKMIINIDVCRYRLLYVWWSFSIFLSTQNESHGKVWHHMKFISLLRFSFERNPLLISDTVILMGKLHTFRLKKFFKQFSQMCAY